eukprot:403357590
MDSQTSYINNLKNSVFQIENTIFENFTYNSDLKVGSQIIRFDEFSEMSNQTENSTFKNVTMRNSQVNFFLFGGFKDNGITNPNLLYLMQLTNLTIVDNIFSRDQAIIKISSYISIDNSQLLISNSTFRNNSFTSGGDLIKATQNTRNPMIIERTNFIRNFQGNNLPMTTSFIKLNTNSRLVIRDSTFTKTLSQSRGSVIFADFQNVDVQIYNSNFTSNFAKEGGLFFVHFGSSLLIDSSIMRDNLAFSGGIATVENQGKITVKNSMIYNNKASKIPVVNILDSYDQTSIFENCTFINNKVMNISQISDILYMTWNLTSQSLTSLKKMAIQFSSAVSLQDDLNFQISIRSITDKLIKLDSNNFTINNTHIQKVNTITSKDSGGAILISNSNYSSTSSIFTNNRAKKGGALRFECSKSKLCKQNMIQDMYTGNIAVIEGGAFSYNKQRPIMDRVNFSQDNYAPYGSNFSGYPYGIKFISQESDLVASGQQFNGEIIVALVDADQNIITNDDSTCFICGVGYYSLQPTSNECSECPAHSDCQGEDKISVNKGYWRSSYYSTNIIECLNEKACIGGQITTNKSLNQLCDYGYGGNLCHSCIFQDDQQFTRIGNHECGLCPSKTTNLLYIIGIFIALVIALLLLLWVNLRNKKESETSITIRILLNYFHILTSASSFNLDWPVYVQKFFGIYSAVGETAESFISFDCFLQDTGFTEPGSSTYYFKVLVIVVLPLALGIIFFIVFFLKKLMFRTSFLLFQRQLIVSCIVLLFAIHPTITRMTSSLFFCMELDREEYWLQTDLQIKCWGKSHLTWSLGIGISGIILWVVGIPVLGFIYLQRNQKILDDPIFFEKYKMMYQGLKKEYFYWEFANILRKVFLISVNVFLNLYPNIFKALLSLLTLSIFMRIQSNIQPYKNPVLNQLEKREIMTSIITFFGALYFVNQEISDTIQSIAFSMIVLVNIWFLALCGYCIFSTTNFRITKIISRYLRKIIMSEDLVAQEQQYKRTKNTEIEDNDEYFDDIQAQEQMHSIHDLEFETKQQSQKEIRKSQFDLKNYQKKKHYSSKQSISELKSFGLQENVKQHNKKSNMKKQNLEDLFDTNLVDPKLSNRDENHKVQVKVNHKIKTILKWEGGITNQSSRSKQDQKMKIASFSKFNNSYSTVLPKQGKSKNRRFEEIRPLSILVQKNQQKNILQLNLTSQTPLHYQKRKNFSNWKSQYSIDSPEIRNRTIIIDIADRGLDIQDIGQENLENQLKFSHLPQVDSIQSRVASLFGKLERKCESPLTNLPIKAFFKEDQLNFNSKSGKNNKKQSQITTQKLSNKEARHMPREFNSSEDEEVIVDKQSQENNRDELIKVQQRKNVNRIL